MTDVDTALGHEVEIVAERFPDADRDEIDRCVRQIYAELARQAEVEAHLLSLTRAQTIEHLRHHGHTFHPLTA